MTSTLPWPDKTELLDLIYPWVDKQRWYPSTDDTPQPTLIGLFKLAFHEDVRLVILEMEDGTLLQVPLAMVDREHNTVDVVCDVPADSTKVIVDGTSCDVFLHAWLADLEYQNGLIDLGRINLEDFRQSLWQTSHLAYEIGQEQSNTSVVFGESRPASIVKFFRVLTPGEQPEIDVPLGLARQGWDHVPLPLAATYLDVTRTNGEEVRCCNASMYQFIDGAADGFDYMCDLAREHNENSDKLAMDELHHLGTVTASMHTNLMAAFGEGDYMSGVLVARRITEQRDLALKAYPQLANDKDILASVDEIIRSVNALGQLPPTQRVHGDFHLGQCLKTPDKWYILDFEGEPLRPIYERILPDQPARDIAGMLRSLDYATKMSDRDENWLKQAEQAFLDGYFEASQADATPPTMFIITAMLVEKTLYELRYEALHRPLMVDIPLSALRTIFNLEKE